MEKYVITMLGEKDHGKSTLIGNLLITTGTATQERINEVKSASKSKRFEPAHILDSFSEERKQEMTIDTTRAEMVYKNAIFELIDVPGHLELIKNMMSGASNSDIAILMVSAKSDEGFRPQTKRHIYLSNMFGVKALIVAVNKIDFVKYDKNEFERIKGEVSDYLKSIKFDKPVAYVPISAYNNENLTSLSKNTPWYKGKPLFDIVSEYATKYSKTIKKNAGLRIVVQDMMGMGKEMAFFGVLHNGIVKVKDKIVIEPEGISATVKTLYLKGKKVQRASEGNNVALVFDKEPKIEKGSVVYKTSEVPHKKGNFEGKLFIIKNIDSRNAKFLMKINNHSIGIKDIKIEKIFSPISGDITKGATAAGANNVVYAKISLVKPYPLEKYDDYSELGRFAVYENDEFIGVGIVE